MTDAPPDLSLPPDADVQRLPARFLRNQGMALMMLDALAILGSLLLAYGFRFRVLSRWMPTARDASISLAWYLQAGLLLLVVWLFLLWRAGGYETGLRSVTPVLLRVFPVLRSAVYALAILMIASFLYRRWVLSRIVYVLTALTACGWMIFLRLCFRALETHLAATGVVAQRVMIAGTDPQARTFADRLAAAGSAIRVIGLVRWRQVQSGETGLFHPVAVLGDLEHVADLYQKHPFEKLVISAGVQAEAQTTPDAMMRIVNFCEETGVSLYVLPASFDIAVSQQEFGNVCGLPTMRLRDASIRPGYLAVKRFLDVVVAGTGLLLGLPLWILIALLVKLTSKGPVFYVQERAGLHGRPFRMIKFRSMVPDADARLEQVVDFDRMEEPVFHIDDDPRVTPFGRWLRRTSLDEIPQLWNVLKGEMSLVGPRPERIDLVNQYNAWQRRRLKAKPGITGYQQVVSRGDPSLQRRIELDLFYLKHQGLLLDAYILLKTVWVVVRGEGT